jgi:hypothetical protein
LEPSGAGGDDDYGADAHEDRVSHAGTLFKPGSYHLLCSSA